MQALRVFDEQGTVRWLLVGDDGVPVEIVGRFLRFLQNRALSPNTVAAYARDLTLFFRFLVHRGLAYDVIGPALVVEFLDFLTHLPVRRASKRQALAAVVADTEGPGRRRAGSSINRTMAAVSSFYEFVITVEVYDSDNPVRKVEDVASARVPERHRPLMGRASRQRPVRRAVRVKTVRRLPRPMTPEDVTTVFAALTTQRDRAMFLLMLDGGLRPGEVLGREDAAVRYATNALAPLHTPDATETADSNVRTVWSASTRRIRPQVSVEPGETALRQAGARRGRRPVRQRQRRRVRAAERRPPAFMAAIYAACAMRRWAGWRF